VLHDEVGLFRGVDPVAVPAARTTTATDLQRQLGEIEDSGVRACVVAVTGPGDKDLHGQLNAVATANGSMFVPVRVDPDGNVRAGPWVRGRSTPCLACFTGSGRAGLSDLLRLDELCGLSAANVLDADVTYAPAEAGPLPDRHERIAVDVLTVLRASLGRRSARSVWGRVLHYAPDAAPELRTWRAVKDPSCPCCATPLGGGRAEPFTLSSLLHANSALNDYAGLADVLGPGWRPGDATPPEPQPPPAGTAAAVRGLPDVSRRRTRTFEDVVLARRSRRTFGPDPLTEVECAHLLFFATGLTHRARTRGGGWLPLRAAPSGGALYPLEVYVYAAAVEDVPRGVYRYQVEGHALEPVADPADLSALALNPPSITAAPAVFLLAATPGRSRAKYLERGYRLVLLEAGHLAQNLQLAATALGLRSCCVAGFLDEAARRAVAVPAASGTDVVYLVAVGR
jgi:SagB-type dehydrogenase family enzyme